MNNGYVAVLDSGIGGISVLKELIKILPNEKYLYYGDNENAPYGNRTIRDLQFITFKNIDKIKKFRIKALVVGCNTLSTNLLSVLSQYANVPTFGVFPPVESELLKGKKVLLLATEKTARTFKNTKNLSIIGLSSLAMDIEKNMFNLNMVNLEKNIHNKNNFYCGEVFCKNNSYDTVILGCTHYYFVKNKIYDHFRPLNLISGEFFTVKKVYDFIKNTKLLEKNKQNEVLFIGKNAEINHEFFKKSGQWK